MFHSFVFFFIVLLKYICIDVDQTANFMDDILRKERKE